MIDKKRQELEAFIREQTLGPGAMRSRFIDLSEHQQPGMTPPATDRYDSELINTIPAGVYSTGILFPVDDTTKGMGEKEREETPANENTPPSVVSDEEIEPDTTDEDESVNIDSQSLNQMYPNSIGLTVCLDPKVAEDNDLEIIISGRYYNKVVLKEPTSTIGVLLEQDKDQFGSFLNQLPEGDAIRRCVRIGTTDAGADYLFLSGDLSLIKDIRSRVKELKIEKAATLSASETRPYRSLDALKEGLFNEIRSYNSPGTERGQLVTGKLRQIETLENSLSHVLDLISLYESSGYGLWRCETFQHRVGQSLPVPVGFKSKKILLYKDEPSLADIHRVEYAKDKWASMAANLQYSKYERQRQRGDDLFLKVQLINTSIHFSDKDTKGGKSYFSMASEEVNRRCFFNASIQVRSKHLLPYKSLELDEQTRYDEDDVNRYIYRQFEDGGLGHGCSVRWGRQDGVPFVSTEYIPMHDTPDVDPSPRPILADTRFLRFKWLSTLSPTSDQQLIEGLEQFVQAYDKWIEEQQDPEHPAISTQIRTDCKKDQVRMMENIGLLLKDAEILLCFRLMNTAMFMQLWHSVKARSGAVDTFIRTAGFEGFFETFYKEKADDHLFSTTDHAAWRPFQLAFILLNLDGIFQRKDDPEWTRRNEWVDLVWFPTGGGKTEAYLGLIALTIINRRRRFDDHGGGTAVLMRYTLRLLTTQQFQRATLLIMALELIRRWDTYRLGKEPIYIGLFVGSGSLPNKLKGENSLEDEYTNLFAAQKAGRSSRSKIPLRKCPWCGHDLDPINFHPDDSKKPFAHNRIFLGCSRADRGCAFSIDYPFPLPRLDTGPIPVSLCDEEIYQHPPALLFGTVDKFAQLAHKISDNAKGRQNDSRRLFGKGNWETGKPSKGYRAPDLIIQDELHLMMGPLGSAVALFESAIDQLCSMGSGKKKVRPKVISSTATTRNTPLQIMALFDRKVNLFPKPGINCDDSFFAFYKRTASDQQDEVHYDSKRRYMGILPTGRTQMWMQLRLAAILFTHRAVFEKEGLGSAYPLDPGAYTADLISAMDNYHTVLTYFNSLREVGKTESQVYSYLVKEIRRVFNNVIRPDKLMHCFYTYSNAFKVGELTGRLSGEEVVAQMDTISSRWSPYQRTAQDTGNAPGVDPPDFVISTNMISVGIDISRFNSMIVNCMPRNIAEYIQASSRVARQHQGLVITVHHPFRSRDISHYERFIEFHEKMYSYVEPISITPFTRKALERYLPLYIATMLRHQHGYPDRTDANSQLSDYEQEVLLKSLLSYFRQRVDHLQGMEGVDPPVKRLLTEENLGLIDHLLRSAIKEWQQDYQKAQTAKESLVFNYAGEGRPERQLYVDIDEYQDNVQSELWRIPQSLRVVDPEAVIHVQPK